MRFWLEIFLVHQHMEFLLNTFHFSVWIYLLEEVFVVRIEVVIVAIVGSPELCRLDDDQTFLGKLQLL